jgi:hypothetical protein
MNSYSFKCPHCECTEWTNHCIIDPDWRNPLTADFSVTETFTCKNCKRDINFPLKKNDNYD